jgi:hypothetical protein
LKRLAVVALLACSKSPPAVAPGTPIYARADVQLDTMKVECDALIAAFQSWKVCPNAEDEQRESIDAWIERAKQDFAAGDKVKLDDKAQHEIAVRCHRAAASVKAAVERCSNGKMPKND